MEPSRFVIELASAEVMLGMEITGGEDGVGGGVADAAGVVGAVGLEFEFSEVVVDGVVAAAEVSGGTTLASDVTLENPPFLAHAERPMHIAISRVRFMSLLPG